MGTWPTLKIALNKAVVFPLCGEEKKTKCPIFIVTSQSRIIHSPFRLKVKKAAQKWMEIGVANRECYFRNLLSSDERCLFVNYIESTVADWNIEISECWEDGTKLKACLHHPISKGNDFATSSIADKGRSHPSRFKMHHALVFYGIRRGNLNEYSLHND